MATTPITWPPGSADEPLPGSEISKDFSHASHL